MYLNKQELTNYLVTTSETISLDPCVVESDELFTRISAVSCETRDVTSVALD